MKFLLPLLLSLILISSCRKEKATTTSEEDTIKKETKDSIILSSPKTRAFQTSTGKSISVIANQKSNGLTDINIVALDFENTKDTLKIEDCDPLQSVWIEDLDQNGYDELYLATTSIGSGSYGTIYGYASNRDLSLSPIYVPEISENDLLPDGAFYGYMGHDSIYVSNHKIYRKYPIYKEGDANCCPSGGKKSIGYQLKQGEASWILNIDSSN